MLEKTLLKLVIETDEGERTILWRPPHTVDVDAPGWAAELGEQIVDLLHWPVGYHSLFQPLSAAPPSPPERP